MQKRKDVDNMKKDLTNPEYIMEKLDCSYEDALSVIAWDTEGIKAEEEKDKEKKRIEKEKKRANALPVGVQKNQVELVREVILDLYPTELFTSKQLSKDTRVVKMAESLGKSAGRWTPHRLKKLEEEGFLISEKPKGVKYYQVKSE